MKPLELKMKNFLGFKEETTVNFKLLYEDKIFLITGPTGAGKTSIFDAVCYALYGEGSGEVRTKAKCFRSQLADEKDEMEVSLLFEVRGRQYFVKRIENARGLNKAYFTKMDDDAEALVKIKEVNQEIESIIGLNLDQFKKIVMIPQGEFREFLTAGTKDKSEILKKLFATEQYEKIQLLIKERFDEKKGVEKDLVTRFSEILREAQVENRDIELGKDVLNEALEKEQKELNALKTEKASKDQEVKLIEQELLLGQKENEELENYLVAKKRHEELRSQKRVYDKKEQELKLLRKISGITHIETQMESLIKEIQGKEGENQRLLLELRKISEQLVRQERSLQDANRNAEEVDNLKETRTRILDLVDKSRRLKEVSQKISVFDAELNKLKEQMNHYSKKEQQLKQMLEEEEQVRKGLAESNLEAEKLKSSQKEQQNYLKELGNLFKKMEKMELLQSNLIQVDRELHLTEKELEQKESNLAEESRKKSGHFALILRQNLQDDVPCPVCGSLDHPLGFKEIQGFDEERFLKAEEEKKRVERRLSELHASIKNLKANIHDLHEEVEELRQELKIETVNAAMTFKIGQEEKQKFMLGEKRLAECLNKVNGLSTKDLALKDLIKSLQQELQNKDNVAEQYEKSRSALLDLSGEQRGLLESGVPKEPLGLISKAEEIEKRVQSLYNSALEAKNAYDKSRQYEENLKGKESTLRETLEQSRAKYAELKQHLLERLQQEALSVEVYNAYRDQVSQMDTMDQEIQEFYQAYNKSKGVFDVLKDRGETLQFKSLEPIQKILQNLLQEQKVLQDQVEAKSILLHGLTRAHERLGRLYDEYLENKKVLALYQDLYDTAYLGMNFETFVQSYYFEGILLRANARLRKMSEGRYQLKRRNETESRREKIGLGLNVFDEYSGRERDVQSLSGGESFKASLSLALGLSDFIESHKGSVNLETIFIDEGFGSLDQDSLENALSCLMELNVSGRIVGIISHVTELKDRIPGKIEVRTTPGNGSAIKITGGTKWN
ncbi:AAA family ATPase [Proteiniclasticum ruminis]|uniref:Nuclease SbcCD subunit C n=1 Tax=Proteiniclasticum ruminis TaxID=398199 RepID=A0A1I4Y6D8_9CLOT|nr:SbcC/MukB-like Walker B domain-containing protein [Proteiniclasticum ruminis]SFN33624.1 exonuclease SbcC [Proteiniclasticum ruminis]